MFYYGGHDSRDVGDCDSSDGNYEGGDQMVNMTVFRDGGGCCGVVDDDEYVYYKYNILLITLLSIFRAKSFRKSLSKLKMP